VRRIERRRFLCAAGASFGRQPTAEAMAKRPSAARLAGRIGVTIPRPQLLRADKVIE